MNQYTQPEDVKDRAQRMRRKAEWYVPLTFIACLFILALICASVFALVLVATSVQKWVISAIIMALCGLFYMMYNIHNEWYNVKQVFSNYGDYQKRASNE